MSDESKVETGNRDLPLFGEWREYRKMDQETVAQLLGTTQASISRWERGESEPKIRQMMELSRVLNATIDDLINRTPFKPDPAMELYLELRHAPEAVQRRALKLIKALLNDHEED